MESGVVFDIRKYSIHDGPGIRTTVFLKGCPLTCWWCHNPEGEVVRPEVVRHPERCIGCGRCRQVCPNDTSVAHCSHCGQCVAVCPADAREMMGRTMTVNEVMAEISKDIAFYDQSGGGVTFSGGEPFAQPAFLLALLECCRVEDLHTAVETSGLVDQQALLQAAASTDLFLYDLKHMDSERHRRYTGVGNDRILANLRLLAERGCRLRIRIPIIPGVNDDESNITATGRFIASLPGYQAVDLLPYHSAAMEKYRKLGRPYLLADLKAPSDEHMARIADQLRSFGLDVKIGG